MRFNGEGFINITSPRKKYSELNTDVKKLLIEKGFLGKISLEQIFARLNSEVGELINAYKKGFPEEEQAEELADVIIYLFNLAYEENTSIDLGLKFVEAPHSYASRGQDIWRAFNEISSDINKLRDSFKGYFASTFSEDTTGEIELKVAKNYLEGSFKEVLVSCETCAGILNINLEEAIESKMKKNFERPYRYNTDPEHFIDKTTF